MKVILIFFVAFCGLAVGFNELSQDLLEFVNLLPVDKINEIVAKYSDDEEFKNITLYVLYDDEFKALILQSETIPEYLKLLDYLEDSGLEVYLYLKLLHEALGIKPIIPIGRFTRHKRSTRVNLKEIRDEIRLIMPQEEIDQLHEKKMHTSKAFKNFSYRLGTSELEVIVKNFNNNKDIQRISETLIKHGIDIKDNMLFNLQMCGFKPFNALSKLFAY